MTHVLLVKKFVFLQRIHPWKANDAETPHELVHKPWLNETIKLHWGDSKWSIFVKLPQVLWCFRSKSVQAFYSRKRGLQGECRDSQYEDLLFETTNRGNRKENDSSEQENLPVYSRIPTIAYSCLQVSRFQNCKIVELHSLKVNVNLSRQLKIACAKV